MTGWISTITGILFGGGWGAFASLVLGLVVTIYLAKMWKKAKQDKAHKDTKDKEAADHAKDIEDNQKDAAQAKEDEEKTEAWKKKIKDDLAKDDPA